MLKKPNSQITKKAPDIGRLERVHTLSGNHVTIDNKQVPGIWYYVIDTFGQIRSRSIAVS